MAYFDVMLGFEADYSVVADGICIGEVFHVARNDAGGSNCTPIARYFAWRPTYIEGFHEHWRIDCYVRKHELSPDPKALALALRDALIRDGQCDVPCWVSWHRDEELGGEPLGDVFDFD